MKGWSFSALVAALKTAAFRDVGTNAGNLIEVGADMGLGLQVGPAQTGVNWQNFNFISGQIISVDMATATNTPADMVYNTGEVLSVHVMAYGPSLSNRVLMVFPPSGSDSSPYYVTMTGTTNSRTFKVFPIVTQDFDLGTKDLNTLTTQRFVGDYAQPLSASATASRNYPATNTTGILRVRRTGGIMIQEYLTREGRMFMRRSNDLAGSWQAWVEFLSIKQRTTIETGSIELYGGTPFLDFHFNNDSADYSMRIINDEVDKLSIRAPNGVRTQLDASLGNVMSSSMVGTWELPNSNQRAPAYRIKDMTVGSASYVPFMAGKITKTTEGYTTTISFGCVTSGVNSGQFQSPVISAYGDNGTYKSWIFNISTGEIQVQDPNSTFTFATKEWANTQYPIRDAISYIGLEFNNVEVPYMQQLNTNTKSYIATRNWTVSQFPTKDYVSTVGLSANDLTQPYLRRASDSAICWLATKDWVNQTFMSNFRQTGQAGLLLASNGVEYNVGPGCVLVGWKTEGSDPLGDLMIYRQTQKFIPALGWVNVGVS